MKNKGIAFKLSVLILTSVTLIFALVLSYNYFFPRQIIVKNIEKKANYVTCATVNQIDKILLSVEKVPINLACFIENSPFTSPLTSTAKLKELLFAVLKNNPEIYGMAVAFEPYAHDASQKHFAPYVHNTPEGTEFTFVPYDYFYWDWYQLPKELDHAVWSEPYYDEGAGNIIMSTYSVPFYKTVDGNRQLMGIVTADISLTWLQKIVASIKIAKSGYGFLISKNGTFITHPDDRLVMNKTIFSVAEAGNDLYLRQLGRKMIKGESDFIQFSSQWGKNAWIAYSPLLSNGWSLGILFPKKELMADLTRLTRELVFISVAGFFLILGVIVLIARSITRPLQKLSMAAEEMATGNLEIDIPRTRSKDEVGRLAESFDYMKTSLKQYIHDLTETTAARQKIESELKIARDIQMAILPKKFPLPGHGLDYEVDAVAEPAKEVGGDFYDFFRINENKLGIAIGDVSGKGVPAALFMALSKSLLKAMALQDMPAAQCVDQVNRLICPENEMTMFVTLFYAVFDTTTQRLEYCNAGHNPPFLLRNGIGSQLETRGGPAVGVVDNAQYKTGSIALLPGDTLFLYTDGITEAMDEQMREFGEQRLKAILEKCDLKSAKGLLDSVLSGVEEFVGKADQADDITALSFVIKNSPQDGIA